MLLMLNESQLTQMLNYYASHKNEIIWHLHEVASKNDVY